MNMLPRVLGCHSTVMANVPSWFHLPRSLRMTTFFLSLAIPNNLLQPKHKNMVGIMLTFSRKQDSLYK